VEAETARNREGKTDSAGAYRHCVLERGGGITRGKWEFKEIFEFCMQSIWWTIKREKKGKRPKKRKEEGRL